MGTLDLMGWPRSARMFAAVFVCLVSAVAGGAVAGTFAYLYAKSLGDADLANLKSQQSDKAATAAYESHALLLQQVTRANETETLLYATIAQHAEEKRQLQERIYHVSTQYISAPGAAAKPIPRCVFTAGWLRDYNAALGVPAPRAGAAASAAEKAAWPTPALKPNYWKAASLLPTSLPTSRTTACGPAPISPSSMACSIYKKGLMPYGCRRRYRSRQPTDGTALAPQQYQLGRFRVPL